MADNASRATASGFVQLIASVLCFFSLLLDPSLVIGTAVVRNWGPFRVLFLNRDGVFERPNL